MNAPQALRLLVQTPEHWREARDVRLEMLADTPLAFTETLQTARRRSDEEWRERQRTRLAAPASRHVAAVDADGRWWGQMRVDVVDGQALLMSVWVHPDVRGTGVAELMLDDLAAHVRLTLGMPELYLEVHEDNPRAIAFYRRYGFVDTGERTPYPLPPGGQELRMRLALG
ncbi:GNAT family N-acetyltransferase [Desertihabitans aurantiacus]|uniref:GNAT family N-acetyltransferase n=1 Tax=Desertihabitans aurantiacus TaxID=2282477 RepID=UPI0018E57342|nr:GNAT family N-acetyltransferase [Desertihabitans aurantiacus]